MVGGGAEKVALLLMKYFDRSKFEITLVLFKKEGEYLSQVPEDVKIIDLGKKSKFDIFKLIWRLRNKINKLQPDAMISFLTYTNAISIISAFHTCQLSKLIISQQIFPSLEAKSRMRKIIYAFLYRKARRIVCASEGIKECLRRDWKVCSERMSVFYNPLEFSNIEALRNGHVEHPCFAPDRHFKVIITVGRLEPQKNHALLLNAFKKVAESTDARLVILGQGRLEQKLKDKAQELGILEKVFFIGFQHNPYAWLSKADVFVLSSDYEGFGNVIIEAMACGVPVISTNCPSGPSEIITSGVNGLLVRPGDAMELSSAIIRLLLHPEEAKRFAQNALESVKKYDISIIGQQYEKEILRVENNAHSFSQ